MTPETATPLGERLLALVGRYRSNASGNASGESIRRGLVHRFAVTQPWHVFLAAALAGLCGTAVVGLLSSSAGASGDSSGNLRTAFLFLLVLLLYRSQQLLVLRSASAAVEQALDRQRTRLAEKVARLDLRGFETISPQQLQGGLEGHFAAISGATIDILQGIQALVLVLLSLVYLATLSAITALLVGAVFLTLSMVWRWKEQELSRRLGEAAQSDQTLATTVGELLDGFKELRLNAAKRAAVLDQIRVLSNHSSEERSISADIFASLLVFGSSASYLLAGSVIFLLPLLSGANQKSDPGLVTAVLFLLGPVSGLLNAAKRLSAAQFALGYVADFEASIDNLLATTPPMRERPAGPFRGLEAKAIRYTHRPQGSDRAFSIGPIDFRLDAGEVVFVTGSNGSGKTTALRVLIGLYTPDAGQLLLNGEPLARDGSDSEAYRQTFGAVFADVHIFRRLYALPPERMQPLRNYLEAFELTAKLPSDLSAGFDPEALSTGQRKRLALAIAMAEDRPVLILDEWAADQDPQSRERFYRRILPQLTADGKSVLAITHDDRYFDAADRRYHMEDGRMTLVAGR